MVFMDNKTDLNIINTNARSLRPKVASFIQCFLNLSLTLAIVTETWFASGCALDLRVESLLLGHGLRTFTLNRDPLPSGVAYGGVAIMLRDSVSRASPFAFANPEQFEVLPLRVSLSNIKRNLFVVAAYIPPGYPVPRGRACLQHISDLVLTIKNRHDEPLILVGGDFNQWDVNSALAEFIDMQEVVTPATRGDRKIDKLFTNWPEYVEEGGCCPPLQTEEIDGVINKSDHNVQYVLSRVPMKEPVKLETFTHRPYCIAGEVAFLDELRATDWQCVTGCTSVNGKVDKLHHIFDDLLNKHFPMKTTQRRESDLPWLDGTAKKWIKKKAAIYRAEGQSPRWETMRTKIEAHLEKRRQDFLAKQRDKFIGPQAHVSFFRNVKSFKSAEKPKNFNVRSLCPGKSDKEVADEVAGFFNRISDEFSPLETHQIPFTYHRDLPVLTEREVEKMIRDAKKPKSMVVGDIFPSLFTLAAGQLAKLVCAIYNQIITELVWPLAWKREFVTVIPKKNLPESLADLRNISCTPLLSKIFESYLLQRIKEETSLKSNQYGGVKGCSTTHMVVGLLQEICKNAEDYRSATVLTAIDYSKAFNRVSFQHCLEAMRKKGASTPVLRLIASFLSNRTMSVRVGNEWSEPLGVSGGCPQGSVVGVLLFNTTTDNLEDDFLAAERERLRLPDPPAPVTPPPPDPIQPKGLTTSTPISRTEGRPTIDDVSPVTAGGFAWEDQDVQYRPSLPYIQDSQPVIHPPPDEESVGTQVLVQKQVRVFKYVDDNLICEKLNFGATPLTTTAGATIKVKQAVSSQNAFRSISCNAERIGMKVNTSKTNVLCVSDALNYTPMTFIVDSAGERIDSTDSLRVLGFNFSSRPTVQLHVDDTVKRIRQRSWFLRNLGKVGFTAEELVRVYRSVILPIADYCAPAYHSMLTDGQDEQLENAQVGALRCIFGYGQSARSMRMEAGLETLRTRRIDLTDKFARKAAADPKFCHWFPLKMGRRSQRSTELYEEKFAKCDRLRNSPLYYMRRRLNGKEGKTYGERNKIYCENFRVDSQ